MLGDPQGSDPEHLATAGRRQTSGVARYAPRYDPGGQAGVLKLRQHDLPLRGSSHDFVGADNGDVKVSAFLFRGLPGAGPGPHRHPYDEVQFIQEGRGTWVVNGQEFEAGAGDIL